MSIIVHCNKEQEMYTNHLMELAKPFTKIYETYFESYANKQARIMAELTEANLEFANKVKKTFEDATKS